MQDYILSIIFIITQFHLTKLISEVHWSSMYIQCITEKH